ADKSKVEVAYCCVNPDEFEHTQEFQKENLILTVGGGGFLFETKRKKLDFFIEVGNYFSEKFPDYNAKFILIGHNEDTETYNYLKTFVKSSNIEILPVINDSYELKSYYQRAKVYCQFSEYESFGIAVIEAMLNKVIPIVYNGGAMPEVVGSTGIIIKDFNISNTADIIKDILDGKYEKLREMAKERVINNFTLQKRKEILFKHL
ncbi:MAG: glycosyltransferase family 4 protein, partial [Ignavibacteria bacterium]